MPTLESPDLETFKPESTYKVLGIDYLTLRHADGVRLDLSAKGVDELGTDPEVAALITRMGEFIAEHGIYRATMDVPESDREPCRIPRVAETPERSASWKRGLRLASVYHPLNVPSVVLKAFEYDRQSTTRQFYLGAWLHDRLAVADDGVSSPAQLAMLQAESTGQRTTVMDYMPGDSLFDIARKLGNDDSYEEDILAIDDAAIAFAGTLRHRIAHITGWRGFLMANDLRTTRNIIDPDPETVTTANLHEREHVSVIDQPDVRAINLPMQALIRYVPVISGNQTAPLETIEQTATSYL